MSFTYGSGNQSYKDFLYNFIMVQGIKSDIRNTGQRISMSISDQTRSVIASNEALARENIRSIDNLSDAVNSGFEELSETMYEGFSEISYEMQTISSGIDALNATFSWGFGNLIASMGRMNDSLSELIQIAKTPAQTAAYEQFEIARDAFRKGLYQECLESLDWAICGDKSNTGYKLEWRFHQLKAIVFLGFAECDPDLIDLEKAEQSFLLAARYAKADFQEHAAKAFLGAGWAAYCQGKMQESLAHTEQAISLDPKLGEAFFQSAKVRMALGEVDAALPILASAIENDPFYAIKAAGDGDFQQYDDQLREFLDSMRNEKYVKCISKAQVKLVAAYVMQQKHPKEKLEPTIQELEEFLANTSAISKDLPLVDIMKWEQILTVKLDKKLYEALSDFSLHDRINNAIHDILIKESFISELTKWVEAPNSAKRKQLCPILSSSPISKFFIYKTLQKILHNSEYRTNHWWDRPGDFGANITNAEDYNVLIILGSDIEGFNQDSGEGVLEPLFTKGAIEIIIGSGDSAREINLEINGGCKVIYLTSNLENIPKYSPTIWQRQDIVTQELNFDAEINEAIRLLAQQDIIKISVAKAHDALSLFHSLLRISPYVNLAPFGRQLEDFANNAMSSWSLLDITTFMERLDSVIDEFKLEVKTICTEKHKKWALKAQSVLDNIKQDLGKYPTVKLDMSPSAKQLEDFVINGANWPPNKFISLVERIDIVIGFTKQEMESLITIAKGEANPLICPITNMEFVKVSGGNFDMGDVWGDGSYDEKPVHDVNIKTYYMAKHPVTVAQWHIVMKNIETSYSHGDANSPVAVNWDDCMVFIGYLNKLCKRNYRLATEAEWEYASRSGGKKEKWSGTDREKNVGEYAWFKENSSDRLWPVGRKKPNSLGLYDMSGNIAEWCQDLYNSSYKGAPNNGSAWVPEGKSHIIRGGGYASKVESIRTSSRFIASTPDKLSGIRLVYECNEIENTISSNSKSSESSDTKNKSWFSKILG